MDTVKLAIIEDGVIQNVISAPRDWLDPSNQPADLRQFETMEVTDAGPGWRRPERGRPFERPTPPPRTLSAVYRAMYEVAKLSQPNMTEAQFRQLVGL